jgi:hypothetical protein
LDGNIVNRLWFELVKKACKCRLYWLCQRQYLLSIKRGT